MYIRIYKEKKSTIQSCPAGNKWILEVIPSVQNSFYGDITSWNATKDTQKQIKLSFDSHESAVKYAEANGMKITDYGTDSIAVNRKKKNYLNNY
jgi:hypothetical protein